MIATHLGLFGGADGAHLVLSVSLREQPGADSRDWPSPANSNRKCRSTRLLRPIWPEIHYIVISSADHKEDAPPAVGLHRQIGSIAVIRSRYRFAIAHSAERLDMHRDRANSGYRQCERSIRGRRTISSRHERGAHVGLARSPRRTSPFAAPYQRQNLPDRRAAGSDAHRRLRIPYRRTLVPSSGICAAILRED